MCNFYFKALNQNAELRSRLNRIHSESVICDQVVSVNIIPSPDEVRFWPLMHLEYKQTLLFLTNSWNTPGKLQVFSNWQVFIYRKKTDYIFTMYNKASVFYFAYVISNERTQFGLCRETGKDFTFGILVVGCGN